MRTRGGNEEPCVFPPLADSDLPKKPVSNSETILKQFSSNFESWFRNLWKGARRTSRGKRIRNSAGSQHLRLCSMFAHEGNVRLSVEIRNRTFPPPPARLAFYPDWNFVTAFRCKSQLPRDAVEKRLFAAPSSAPCCRRQWKSMCSPLTAHTCAAVSP